MPTTPPSRTPAALALETPRLHLTLVETSDFDAIWRLQSDPEVMRYIRKAETDREVVRQRLAMWSAYNAANPGFGVVALRLKPDGDFVGYAVLRHVNFQPDQEIEVGYTIATEFAGRGLATELTRALTQYAFERLGAPRVVAYTDPENLASQNVLRKCGFHFAGAGTVYSANDAFFVLDRPG
jgi:ribosomal-protein-alanine N-acetyltransferase